MRKYLNSVIAIEFCVNPQTLERVPQRLKGIDASPRARLAGKEGKHPNIGANVDDPRILGQNCPHSQVALLPEYLFILILSFDGVLMHNSHAIRQGEARMA